MLENFAFVLRDAIHIDSPVVPARSTVAKAGAVSSRLGGGLSA